jgi:hypothetical protein
MPQAFVRNHRRRKIILKTGSSNRKTKAWFEAAIP